MKQKWLLLLAAVPFAVNWLHGATLFMANGLFFYLLPIGMAALWLWVGWRYAHSGLGFLWSILGANWAVILTLPVYWWQFWLVDDALRSISLAVFSQVGAIFSLHTAWLARLFEPDPHSLGMIMTTAMMVLGVLEFLLLFAAGYFAGKLRERKGKA